MAGGERLDPSVLREYDIRGVVGETLSREAMRTIGRSFATIADGQGALSVAVGYDGRLTSAELEAGLVEGLTASGLTVYRIGMGPTPMLYFAVHHLGADAGMIVTGSHNPPEYNGVKISLNGRPFFAEQIQDLGKVAASGEFATGAGATIERSVEQAYVARLLRDLSPGRPLRVAWDPGNGAAAQVLRRLCDGLPGRHVLINDTVDGRFPAHHPDPTVEENLEELKRTVAEQQCDLGVAFDGDGDRIGVIDSRGRVLWGDQLLLILAGPVLAERPGATIIADVKASQVFFDEIARRGGRALMSRTGHSLIKTLMAETGAPLAGEMSGHVFFADRYYGYDDALYAAVRLLSVLGGSPVSLAEMRDALPEVVNTPELRIDCAEERKFAVVEEVRERLRKAGAAVCDVDGVRVSSEDGWWLLRASNTQPVLVGRCEAANRVALARQIAHLEQQLRESGITPAEIPRP